MFNIIQVVLCTFYVYMINCKQKIQHEDHVVTYQVANPIRAIVSSGPKNIILLFKYKQCALKTI